MEESQQKTEIHCYDVSLLIKATDTTARANFQHYGWK